MKQTMTKILRIRTMSIIMKSMKDFVTKEKTRITMKKMARQQKKSYNDENEKLGKDDMKDKIKQEMIYEDQDGHDKKKEIKKDYEVRKGL